VDEHGFNVSVDLEYPPFILTRWLEVPNDIINNIAGNQIPNALIAIIDPKSDGTNTSFA
jgi:hypothetical protein